MPVSEFQRHEFHGAVAYLMQKYKENSRVRWHGVSKIDNPISFTVTAQEGRVRVALDGRKGRLVHDGLGIEAPRSPVAAQTWLDKYREKRDEDYHQLCRSRVSRQSRRDTPRWKLGWS